MTITDFSKEYHERMFPGYESKFLETDPEFIEFFDNFAFDEVVNQDDLDDKTRLDTICGFAGVYSGRIQGKSALDAQLGIVWKKEVIEEIIEGKVLDSITF